MTASVASTAEVIVTEVIVAATGRRNLVRGLDTADLTRREERYVTVLRSHLRRVAGLAADRVARGVAVAGAGAPSVDDVAATRVEWAQVVDDVILPYVAEVFTDSALQVALGVAESLPEDVRAAYLVPPVRDEVAEVYLSQRRNFLTGVGDELWFHTREALVEGMRAGDGVPALRDRVWAAADLTYRRAEAVARTEVVGAANAAGLEQVRATGIHSTKSWLATADARTRRHHAVAGGQEVALDETFDVGGHAADRPHDPVLPASEVVNCRCTLLYDVGDVCGGAVAAAATSAFHLRGQHDQSSHSGGGHGVDYALGREVTDRDVAGEVGSWPQKLQDQYATAKWGRTTVQSDARTNPKLLGGMRKAHDEFIQRAAGSVSVQVTPAALNGILRDHRLKTQHEVRPKTRASGYVPDVRRQYESTFMGVPHDTAVEHKPVYGYVGHSDVIERYGSVRVELHDHVRSRTTVTSGDSLNGVLNPVRVDDVATVSASRRLRAIATGTITSHAYGGRGAEYVEAQVHGGVGLADVKTVHLPADLAPRFQQKLEKAGIGVNVT